jgi:hypothetical protein
MEEKTDDIQYASTTTVTVQELSAERLMDLVLLS